MTEKSINFEWPLPTSVITSGAEAPVGDVRKYSVRLARGKSVYDVRHELATEDVLVQTRIAGRVREGGISIVDENTVRIEFGGPLHEDMDVVIIG